MPQRSLFYSKLCKLQQLLRFWLETTIVGNARKVLNVLCKYCLDQALKIVAVKRVNGVWRKSIKTEVVLEISIANSKRCKLMYL